MANKIDTVIDAVETKLNELVEADGSGVLAAVERGVINPLKGQQLPVCGVAPSRFRREGAIWVCEMLIMLAARTGTGDADTAITDVLIEVDAAIEALVDAGTAGGVIDDPVWDSWYQPRGDSLAVVGAIATLRFKVESPLKT